MAKLIFTSDLHGKNYETFFKEAERVARTQGLDGILIGGDIAISADPTNQKRFITEDLTRTLKQFKGALPPVYIIPGNDDWRVVEKELRNLSETNPNVIVPIGKAYPLVDDLQIVGYPFVPLGPLCIKDYEKWDGLKRDYERWNLEVPKDVCLTGVCSNKDSTGYEEKVFQRNNMRDNIARDLAEISEFSDPSKTVYLFHAPPRGIFDKNIAGAHCGSLAISDFIHNEKPLLTLHGHIHDAVGEKDHPIAYHYGAYSAACGQADPDKLNYLYIAVTSPQDVWVTKKSCKEGIKHGSLE